MISSKFRFTIQYERISACDLVDHDVTKGSSVFIVASPFRADGGVAHDGLLVFRIAATAAVTAEARLENFNIPDPVYKIDTFEMRDSTL